MQVILLEDVPSLGKIGDLVKVSDGYGRNYLIPQKKAVPATDKSIHALEHQKRQVEQRITKAKKDAERLAQKIEAVLKEGGMAGDRKKILLEEPIKSLGMYTVPVKLHPEVTAHLKVWVVQ